MTCESEFDSSLTVDETLLSLEQKKETLLTYLNILAGCRPDEEICPKFSEIEVYMDQVKQDIVIMKDHVVKMKQKNEEIKVTMERLAKANDYLDDLENNIPEGFCAADAVARDVVPAPPSAVFKEPFQLRTLLHLTDQEFEEIPFYLRGRLRLGDVNDFIDGYNQTLEKKYNIMKASRDKLKMADRQLYTIFRNQELRNVPGLVFCTEEDMKRFSNVKSGVYFKNMVAMLRHTQRIKEIRMEGIVRLAVASSAAH
ncbi:spindle and kinetochore-associated protein 1 [Anabrus simplex]|uniref:spindle and kinetochore-associated protein 1 n=1 Tax=Anabrus simplex TaxID=316456 RepID=UPI0035A37040